MKKIIVTNVSKTGTEKGRIVATVTDMYCFDIPITATLLPDSGTNRIGTHVWLYFQHDVNDG